MKDISDLIARKEYLPATEDIQQELVELFGKRRVEQDSLIQNFASGMISGAVSATVAFFICAPFIHLISKQKSIDWKVYMVTHLFFAVVCSIVIKHFLGFKGLPRSNS
ncbi:MAG: hypothetical protein ACRCU0_04655 [Candidatus Rhabdochlamydia sp.]